jgi:tetrapyrrole methylase family protein / MazG family protein
MTTEISELVKLIQTLRADGGCPWDKKQTPGSMAVYLVEEVYELVDAIESGTISDIREELGDVLFQILFIISIFEASGDFNLVDVADTNRKKMIRRHPHVFGDAKAETARQVKVQWQKIKGGEDSSGEKKSILDSIPRKLPALMKAYRISDRAAGNGFDWDDIDGVMAKTEEEWSEFKYEVAQRKKHKSDKNKVMMEFGDILFTLVNVARFARIHPETALSASTKKFEKRFRYMEQLLHDQGQKPNTAPRPELERLWEMAKKELG